ncbi:hypothetical protein Tco_0941528 [Tanacetum coccineum]|uniref:Uncharacterized protein n=1 Tax=Tanacetum coccineum TaxID=301880 RepID=A0ABQ5DS05_9ASTR
MYLLREDLLFQIDNKDAKKTNKMSYPRFTKFIIDYFMSKNQSISRKNKMFWHTDWDDTMFTSMRCISRHEDTQIYGTILPKELTNQVMLESKAYKTYYAFAYGEKTPKPKYVRKKTSPDKSPKQKPVQATKGTRIKTKAKVSKFDKKKQPAKMPKAKGLDVLSKVALTEAGYQKKQERLSHITYEGTGTKPRVLDVPKYDSESDKESWGDSNEEDNDDDDFKDNADNNDDDSDDNDESDDKRTESDRDEILDPNKTNEEHDKEEEEYDEEFNI